MFRVLNETVLLSTLKIYVKKAESLIELKVNQDFS